MAPCRSPGSRDDPSRATEDRPGSWTPGWRPDSAPVRRSRPLAGTGNGIANRRVADATVGGGPARRPRTVPAIAVRRSRLACRAAARAAGCPGRRFRELRRARDPQGRERGTAAESRRIGRFRRAGRTSGARVPNASRAASRSCALRSSRPARRTLPEDRAGGPVGGHPDPAQRRPIVRARARPRLINNPSAARRSSAAASSPSACLSAMARSAARLKGSSGAAALVKM